MSYGAALIIFLTMATVTYSVIARILFKTPLPGLTDMVSMANGLTVAFALSVAQYKDKHVRVDFVREYMPKAISQKVYVIINALMLMVLAFISYRFALYAMSTLKSGSQTWIMAIPYWPVVTTICLGLIVFWLTVLYRYISTIMSWKEAKE